MTMGKDQYNLKAKRCTTARDEINVMNASIGRKRSYSLVIGNEKSNSTVTLLFLSERLCTKRRVCRDKVRLGYKYKDSRN